MRSSTAARGVRGAVPNQGAARDRARRCAGRGARLVTRLGKTSLAFIIREELGVGIRCVAGRHSTREGDMAAILTGLERHDVLFVDEIHRLNRSIEEILYPALEDFRSKSSSARALRRERSRSTCRRIAGSSTVFVTSDSTTTTRKSSARSGRLAVSTWSRGRQQDRAPLARHAADGEQDPQARGAASRSPRSLMRSRARRLRWTARASSGSIASSSTRSSSSSAAPRSACRRSRWRGGRTRSRTSTSPLQLGFLQEAPRDSPSSGVPSWSARRQPQTQSSLSPDVWLPAGRAVARRLRRAGAAPHGHVRGDAQSRQDARRGRARRRRAVHAPVALE